MGTLGKLIAALAIGSCAAQAETPTSSLTVLVYDYADIPAGKLQEAEAIAARSYGAAGIKVNWLPCPTVQEDTEEFRACDRSVAGSPYLRIYPERMAAGSASLKKVDDALGAAAGLGAIIVYSRVHKMAKEWNYPEEIVLGRALAHELGHILLGDNSHSSQGLMKPHFGKKDLSHESAQYLFDPKQASRLRELIAGSSAAGAGLPPAVPVFTPKC